MRPPAGEVVELVESHDVPDARTKPSGRLHDLRRSLSPDRGARGVDDLPTQCGRQVEAVEDVHAITEALAGLAGGFDRP